ncbi:MAG: energy transducer TonB [Acidobacteria bacterium]|nr:energy transducer TonB [Acidobacteriota bacterium]
MNGLDLGPLRFAPGASYTPPERRKRHARAGGARGVLRGERHTTGAAGPWLSIHPDGGASYTPLLSTQPKRIQGALGVSVAGHAVAALFLFMVVRTGPVVEEIVELERTIYDSIIWIPQEGPGGGGGGGGNESLEVPREVEVEGEDEVSIPIEEPEEFVAPSEVTPEPEERPLEAQKVRLSAVPMAAAPRSRTGIMQGLMARSLDSAGSGTGGGAGDGAGGGIGPGQGDGLGPGSGGGSGGGPYRPGNGVETPQPLRQARPNYTSEAMRAKIQGEVIIEAVVLPDGSVGDVKIVRSLDQNFGLDEEALKAARQWLFRPGTRFGEPVAVLVTIALTFTLR